MHRYPLLTETPFMKETLTYVRDHNISRLPAYCPSFVPVPENIPFSGKNLGQSGTIMGTLEIFWDWDISGTLVLKLINIIRKALIIVNYDL